MFNISICLCSDNNYVQHLGATISSVLKNKNSDEFINIYIIDGGITEENKLKLSSFEAKYDCRLTYLKPDMDLLKNCVTFKGDYLSLATYYRLLIPELMQSEDRVIYLDCDIIVRKSLRELYSYEFNDNLVLGVIDVSSEGHSRRLGLDKYINAGVILMNTRLMREEKTVEKMFKWLAENPDKIECHDQDIINVCVAGRLKYVDEKYNVQVRREGLHKFDKLKDPAILHFISPKKPWTYWKPLNSTRWSKEYFEALQGTPWEGFVKEYRIKSLKYLPLRVFYPTGAFSFLVRKIFSVRNSSMKTQKIITILGFEFRVKRVKVVKEV